MTDIRWKQRFNHFIKAFQSLVSAVELAGTRDLSNLEKQGLIQCFKFTHELGWNVLNDYLGEKGVVGLIGPKDAARDAFKNGLIEDSVTWMNMIADRKQALHTYDDAVVQPLVDNILNSYFPAFEALARKFTALSDTGP